MRLLHTASLELEEFLGEVPPYAILSHTWEGKEVTYQDIQNGRAEENKRGYEKIRNASLSAAKAMFEYIWIDTCCINKTNNTELTEAINSMYNWYREAKVCFAYLADVPPNDDLDTSKFYSTSKWFTRGWTLQELIGPSEVIFFAHDWTRIGTKDALSSVISRITGIPERFLLGDDAKEASVAQRMSWAAKRKTTKVEDIAYCLLGIFDIRMPLIYGERERAFRRLQEEIIKVSDDQSIFAWRVEADADTTKVNDEVGLLALSPTSFKYSGNIIQSSAPRAIGYLMAIRTPFHLSNKGLHLTLPLVPIGDKNEFLAILSCGDVAATSKKRTAIWMKDISTNGGRYMRVKSDKLEMVDMGSVFLRYAQICAQFLKTDVSMEGPEYTIRFPIGWFGWGLMIFPLVFGVQYILHGSMSLQMFAIITAMTVICGAICLFIYLRRRRRRRGKRVHIWLREADLLN